MFAAEDRSGMTRFFCEPDAIYKKQHLKILARSRSLKGYAYFIGKIHEYIREGATREDAIRRAIIYSKENDIMQDYLVALLNLSKTWMAV
jgi:hypothetical protein